MALEALRRTLASVLALALLLPVASAVPPNPPGVPPEGASYAEERPKPLPGTAVYAGATAEPDQAWCFAVTGESQVEAGSRRCAGAEASEARTGGTPWIDVNERIVVGVVLMGTWHCVLTVDGTAVSTCCARTRGVGERCDGDRQEPGGALLP